MQQAQASREDRIRAITAAISQKDLSQRQMVLNGRLPHDLARILAELAVDAVVAADDREDRRLKTSRGLLR
ncbi:hypothetical protein MZTS_22830 [Methylorubrum zatmanii]|nr:hypothetical protein [Methylorubrum zatmanii]